MRYICAQHLSQAASELAQHDAAVLAPFQVRLNRCDAILLSHAISCADSGSICAADFVACTAFACACSAAEKLLPVEAAPLDKSVLFQATRHAVGAQHRSIANQTQHGAQPLVSHYMELVGLHSTSSTTSD